MGPVEALEIALKKEMDSYEMYKNLALRYSEVREICEFLMNEEGKHRNLIEKKIAELTKY